MNDNFKSIDHKLNALFNFKIDDNIPKFLLSYNNLFLSVYENNQITLINFKLLDVKRKNIIKEKMPKIEINKNEKRELIPKVTNYSDIYSEKYHPNYLFSYSSDKYYCSSDAYNKHYFELDFSQEYFILLDLKYYFHKHIMIVDLKFIKSILLIIKRE